MKSIATWNKQQQFDVRLEWGINGLRELLAGSDVIIIIDILSFSTAVDIATAKGAKVFPYRYKDETAKTYAIQKGAVLAGPRTLEHGLSLSPTSLIKIEAATSLVLPSPNGATLSLETAAIPTLCACLRNAKAVAQYAKSIGDKVTVIAAGEKWPDGSLRVAFEDLIGAGAVIDQLKDELTLSVESRYAAAVFDAMKTNLDEVLMNCGSGQELIDRGFKSDVLLASDLNSSDNVPLLKGDYYVSVKHRKSEFGT